MKINKKTKSPKPQRSLKKRRINADKAKYSRTG